jgi:hypothetical protein
LVQIFEHMEVIHSPASPGSRPKPKSYDALRVARETAEEVSQIQRVSSKGSPMHTRFHASESRLDELSFGKVTFHNDALNNEHGSSGMLSASRRADSVASCASEWVNQRNDGGMPESAPAETDALGQMRRCRQFAEATDLRR